MRYELHPEAALEHEEQVAYYEARTLGLGSRYHAAFRRAAASVCKAPKRYRVVAEPGLRNVSPRGFPHHIICREVADAIQIIAVAHDRWRPGYWSSRV